VAPVPANHVRRRTGGRAGANGPACTHRVERGGPVGGCPATVATPHPSPRRCPAGRALQNGAAGAVARPPPPPGLCLHHTAPAPRAPSGRGRPRSGRFR